ncbi:MAG: sulfatase-like hydrolase/transferase, partial [Planctomycetaceae bacterium]
HFGKWHLCARVADAPMPIAYGVDEHALWVAPPNAIETDHRRVFGDAVAFLREHKDRPFYLNLWIKETHLAHDPSEQSLKEHAHLDEQQRVYSAVVADGDKGVGKVLAALKEFGLEDNTIVIFTSDNGPENTGREDRKAMGSGYGGYYSVGSTGELRGRKRSLYEGGVRLPFIVRWPGRVPAGKVNKSTVLSAVDLLPTVCAAASVSLPDGYAPDGVNMLPALLGKDVQRTKSIFWDWRGKDTPKDCWPRGAVRDGDWKLLTDNAGRRELYRSVDDWAESRNFASEYPEIVAELSAQLKAWQATLPEQPAADNISREGRPKRPDRGKTKQRGDAGKKESCAQTEHQLLPQEDRGRTALEPKSSTALVPLNELTPDPTYKRSLNLSEIVP